ncbi:uncharacterized protein LOC121879472, partial [Homarus americanus]|uniref:uncharacterized protein LOC121879472 n=1 Tax=Homarus americanus TaxID=6706 RepID=UPI001C4496AF
MRRMSKGDDNKIAEQEAGEESSESGADDDVMCQARKDRRNKRKRGERKKDKKKKKKKKKKQKTEHQRKAKDVQSEEIMTSDLLKAHSSVVDPFEGDEWNGYSPDLWETQVAAGSSGLTEVSFGPALNVSDPQKWLELTVAVDHTVIAFHGEDEVEKYVFTLFNIVSTEQLFIRIMSTVLWLLAMSAGA